MLNPLWFVRIHKKLVLNEGERLHKEMVKDHENKNNLFSLAPKYEAAHNCSPQLETQEKPVQVLFQQHNLRLDLLG